MEEAATGVDAQQAKTKALLQLRKARATRDATKTALQQKQSEISVTNRYGVGYDAAADAQISGLKTQLEKNEQELTTAQNACNAVSCETVVVAGQVDVKESSDGTISYNDDSLPFWVYILIALFVIGLVVGIVWFVIRDRSKTVVSLFSVPTPEEKSGVNPLFAQPLVANDNPTPISASANDNLLPLVAEPLPVALKPTTVSLVPQITAMQTEPTEEKPTEEKPKENSLPISASISAPIEPKENILPAIVQPSVPQTVVAKEKEEIATQQMFPKEPFIIAASKTPIKAPTVQIPEKTPLPQ